MILNGMINVFSIIVPPLALVLFDCAYRWRLPAPSLRVSEPCEERGQRGADGRVLRDNLSITPQYPPLIAITSLIAKQPSLSN